MPSLCELCNPARYVEPEWMEIHQALEPYAFDKHVFAHVNGGHVYRKGWEWTHCIYGLRKLGALHPSAKGLGVGAGREAPIFFLGDHVRDVTALDLYGNAEWSHAAGQEANVDVTLHPENWCPKRMNFNRIRFIHGSGTDLELQDEEFDFCWTLSSIEHFGGHRAAAQAMREMARVTKSQGIVAVATEYLLLPEYSHPEYFNKKDLQRFIIEASPDLALVSEIDWDTLPYEYLVDSVNLPSGVDRIRRHVVLNDGNIQWTSVLLFFRKR